MSLPLMLAAATIAMGFLPTAWLWHARASAKTQWLVTVAATAGLVTFAFISAPWLFIGYYLRYLAAAAFATVVILSVRLRHRIVVPRASLSSRLTLVVPAVACVLAIGLNVLARAARIRPAGAVDVAFPLASGTYSVLQGGNSILTNPFHRSQASERFALDLVALNSCGARARGLEPQTLGAYAVFNAPVFSPCDGQVIESVDGVADNPPGRADVASPAGNHIIVRCQGVELLLAHLRQGSVTVHAPERVVRRQPIGHVGNSGNTSEPHLHISASMAGRALPLTFGGRFLSLNSVWRDR